MNNFFLDFYTTKKNKLGSIWEKLTQRRNRREQVSLDCCYNKCCAFTQFFQKQKNHKIVLLEHLERYFKVLSVFGVNSLKYDLNLIISHLLPILVNKRNIELTVIKKVNRFNSFKLGLTQLLKIMNFPGGATSLDSMLKAYKT